MKQRNNLILLILGSLLWTGCLQTRAQLRSSGSQGSVQEVQVSAYAVDELKAEFTRLNGRVEDLERTQQEAQSGGLNSDSLKKIEERIAELEQAQADLIEALKRLQTTLPVPEDSGLFEKAKRQLEAGEFKEAAESFSNYLKASKPLKKEEATFLRGEAYFGEGEFKKAIVDFSVFPEQYPKSSRMPKVLLRLGLSFEALDMAADAKPFYQELIDRFPNSKEAREARKKVVQKKK